MGKLRPPYFNQGVCDVNGNVTIPIVHNNNVLVWEVEQIAVQYRGTTNANPRATVVQNGALFSGTGQLLRNQQGYGVTFAGIPYMYMESDDTVQVQLTGGVSGTEVDLLVQYVELDYGHDSLQGRF